MKSTTGAYGDYPEYYYEEGNLFGSYLLGRTPAQSWSDPEEALGGQPVILPGRAPRTRRKPPPRKRWDTELGGYVHAHFPAELASMILTSLGGSRRLEKAPPNADVYTMLDEFAATALTQKDRDAVLRRLKNVVREGERGRTRNAKKRKPASAPRKPVGKKAASKKAPRSRSSVKPNTTSPAPVGDRTCALCGKTLSEEQRALCSRKPSIFYGRGYCAEHAAKLEGLAK